MWCGNGGIIRFSPQEGVESKPARIDGFRSDLTPDSILNHEPYIKDA